MRKAKTTGNFVFVRSSKPSVMCWSGDEALNTTLLLVCISAPDGGLDPGPCASKNLAYILQLHRLAPRTSCSCCIFTAWFPSTNWSLSPVALPLVVHTDDSRSIITTHPREDCKIGKTLGRVVSSHVECVSQWRDMYIIAPNPRKAPFFFPNFSRQQHIHHRILFWHSSHRYCRKTARRTYTSRWA